METETKKATKVIIQFNNGKAIQHYGYQHFTELVWDKFVVLPNDGGRMKVYIPIASIESITTRWAQVEKERLNNIEAYGKEDKKDESGS